MEFEVLGSKDVTVSSQGIEWAQSMVGQLTQCRTTDGVIFYVREALNSQDAFTTSSNQRWGEKHGSVSKRRQALYLAAPPREWSRIADLVAASDHLQRPVLPNRRFTLKAAETQFDGREQQLDLPFVFTMRG